MGRSSKIVRFSAFVLLAVFASGCMYYPGGIAPSTTPIEGKSYIVLGDAEGTDSYVLLFGLIPIFGSNSTQEAIKDALESENGDALIDVTVETSVQWWILFIRQVIRVKGKAIRFTS
jgi:hypothetical protein